ncbi:sister chromatid cohesion protein PDS5 [Halocatena marina]|uniref:sister chromatid cohesion protein PDS5 n=1 Tax=Halocatena marina TaxID=2934937 RepID=UPI00201081EA|nr:sister chromatid cohesion protein PDS5 [Halocatena marina]
MTDDIDVKNVIQTLEDGAPREQEEALSILRDISHSQPNILATHLDAICSFADDEDPMVRFSVATVLVNVAAHEPSVVLPHAPVVRTMLMDDDSSVLSFATTTAMIIASESPTALSGIADRLLELLIYKNVAASKSARDIRVSAASTLGKLGEVDQAIASRADEPLANRLDDPEPRVRRAAVTALTRFGLSHPDVVSTGLARLPERLDDEDAEVRRKAIRAYTLFRHDQPAAIVEPEAVVPALERAAERAELDRTEASGIDEACEYIERMMADQS